MFCRFVFGFFPVFFYKSGEVLHPALKKTGVLVTFQTSFFLSLLFLFLQKKCNPFYFSLFLQYLKGIKTSNVLTDI